MLFFVIDNGVGDICENDFDLDSIPNSLDNCPNNAQIGATDFRTFQMVTLNPHEYWLENPNWIIYNKGAEIVQTANSKPVLAVGFDLFAGVDYEGTFFVEDTVDDDYVGFIFSYQNNQKFYVVMWKKVDSTLPAVQLKLVDSITGPSSILGESLWNTGSTPNQVKQIWETRKNIGWKPHTAYRWKLIHRPKIGLIRLHYYDGKNLVADSGNVFDNTLKGGRLGVYCFSQQMIKWSNLVYKCNDRIPQKMHAELPTHLKNNIEIEK